MPGEIEDEDVSEHLGLGQRLDQPSGLGWLVLALALAVYRRRLARSANEIAHQTARACFSVLDSASLFMQLIEHVLAKMLDGPADLLPPVRQERDGEGRTR